MSYNRTYLLCLMVLLISMRHVCAESQRMDTEIDSAIDKGLVYLARQQKSDGAIGEGQYRVATTALSMLSFIASGNAPDTGRHGLVVRTAIDFLVAQVPEAGYVGNIDQSRMYGQGIVTLALAESYGLEHDRERQKKIRSAIDRLVKVILDAQNLQKNPPFSGAWRYEPTSKDADLSLSGWNALALRASQNIGVHVPKDRVERAIEFVKACYRKDQNAFAYQPGQESTPGMTSVAILNLYLLDADTNIAPPQTHQWLRDHLVNNDTRFLYYSLYYSSQAANQLGGDTLRIIWENNRKLLLSRQLQDGGWSTSTTGEEPGRIYPTTMAILSLSIPYQLLPIYQK